MSIELSVLKVRESKDSSSNEMYSACIYSKDNAILTCNIPIIKFLIPNDLTFFRIKIFKHGSGVEKVPLGSLSFSSMDITEKSPNSTKFSTNLFENDDDTYDGDYKEDDEDFPQIELVINILNILHENNSKAAFEISDLDLINCGEFLTENIPGAENLLVDKNEDFSTNIENELKNYIKESENKGNDNTLILKEDKEVNNISNFKCEESLEHQIDIDKLYNLNNEDFNLIQNDIQVNEKHQSPETAVEITKEAEIKELIPAIEIVKIEDNKWINEISKKTSDLISCVIEDYEIKQKSMLRNNMEYEKKIKQLENELNAQIQVNNNININYEGKEKLLKIELSTTKIETKQNNEKLNLMVKNIETAVNNKDQALNSLKQEIFDKNTQIEEIKSKFELSIQQFQKSEDSFKSLIELNEMNIKEKELQLEESSKENFELKNKVNSLSNENDNLKEEIQRIKACLKEKEDKFVAIENSLKDLTMESQKRQGMDEIELTTLRNENEILNSKIKELNAKIDLMKLERNLPKTYEIEPQSNITYNEQLILQIKLLQEELTKVTLKSSESYEAIVLVEKENHDKLIKNFNEQINVLKANINNKDNEIIKLNAIIEELTGKLRSFDFEKMSYTILMDEFNKYKNSVESTVNSASQNTMKEIEKLTKENQENKVKISNQENYFQKLLREISSFKSLNSAKDEEISNKINSIKLLKNTMVSLKQQLYQKEQSQVMFESKSKESFERLKLIEQKIKDYEVKLNSYRELIKEKEKEIQELRNLLNEKDIRLKENDEKMRESIKQVDAFSSELKMIKTIKETLENEAKARITQIDFLKNQLINNSNNNSGNQHFAPDTSDKIDQMFAQYINMVSCPVKLTRVGDGQYLFGSKKIFAKIQNERLIIRVGGGYMMIDEFLSTYTGTELAKINKMEEIKTARKENANPGSNDNSILKDLKDNSIVQYDSSVQKVNVSVSQKSLSPNRINVANENPHREKSVLDIKFPAKIGVRAISPIGKINGTNRTKVLKNKELNNIKAALNQKNGEQGAPLNVSKRLVTKGNISVQSESRLIEQKP